MFLAVTLCGVGEWGSESECVRKRRSWLYHPQPPSLMKNNGSAWVLSEKETAGMQSCSLCPDLLREGGTKPSPALSTGQSLLYDDPSEILQGRQALAPTFHKAHSVAGRNLIKTSNPRLHSGQSKEEPKPLCQARSVRSPNSTSLMSNNKTFWFYFLLRMCLFMKSFRSSQTA